MKTILFLATMVVLSWGKIIETNTVSRDTTKVPLFDSAVQVKTMYTKIQNHYLDTVKLLVSDTFKTYRVDTLKPVTKVKKVK